ncbi:MAG: DNA-3-methyladenine glycosylase family protein [Acetobacteraceae bacterium]
MQASAVAPGAGADTGHATGVFRLSGPFDLRLSLAAAAKFAAGAEPPPTLLKTSLVVNGEAATIEVSQPAGADAPLHVLATPDLPEGQLRTTVHWLVTAELDLRPFYALAQSHPVMKAVSSALPGLKPLRPASLFEMAIIAITEQQISLAAAFHVRTRIIERFGTVHDDLRLFPSPEQLAAASLPDLRTCGVSQRKAEYIRDLAARFVAEAWDFRAFEGETDQRIREALVRSRGFGEWSVDYILNRGFGRPDSLPAGDVGLQRVVGHYLTGTRLAAQRLQEVLEPFRPYRGLAAFYLAAHWRLREGGKRPPTEPSSSAAPSGSARRPAAQHGARKAEAAGGRSQLASSSGKAKGRSKLPGGG